jgi:hypothetical protein
MRSERPTPVSSENVTAVEAPVVRNTAGVVHIRAVRTRPRSRVAEGAMSQSPALVALEARGVAAWPNSAPGRCRSPGTSLMAGHAAGRKGKGVPESASRRFWLGPRTVGERASQKHGVAAPAGGGRTRWSDAIGARLGDRGGPPSRHCLALALEALSGLLPGAPLTDEQHELRSSHHRPGSELAAVSARRCQRLIAGETSSGLSA